MREVLGFGVVVFGVCASSWFQKGLGFRGFVQGRLGLRNSGGILLMRMLGFRLCIIYGVITDNQGLLFGKVLSPPPIERRFAWWATHGCLMQAPDKYQ